MRHHLAIPTLALASVLMLGCSTIPERNPDLDNARADFSAADNDPQVAQLATEQLKQAREALARADQSLEKKDPPEVTNHLAYLAKQKVAIAQEQTKLKRAEKVVADAALERGSARLDARTAEADSSKQRAVNAERSSQNKSEQLAVAAANTERDQASMARMQEALRGLNARTTERGMVITLGDVLFDTNSAHLKAGGVKSVEKLAAFFKQYPDRRAQVEGFTDSTGSDSHNQILSEERASSVGRALVGAGVESSRITTRGFGESNPVADNNTRANRQLNRRVEVIVSNENGEIPSSHSGMSSR